MYYVIVFILLGVSSLVCCLPADKGKGVADYHEHEEQEIVQVRQTCGIGYCAYVFSLYFVM